MRKLAFLFTVIAALALLAAPALACPPAGSDCGCAKAKAAKAAKTDAKAHPADCQCAGCQKAHAADAKARTETGPACSGCAHKGSHPGCPHAKDHAGKQAPAKDKAQPKAQPKKP